MNFRELAHSINEERIKHDEAVTKAKAEYQRNVRAHARSIRLKDVIEAIEFSPDSDSRLWDFEPGKTLTYRLRDTYFDIHISPGELFIKGYYDVEMARFRGTRVTSQYNKYAAAIQKAKEDGTGVFNVPF